MKVFAVFSGVGNYTTYFYGIFSSYALAMEKKYDLVQEEFMRRCKNRDRLKIESPYTWRARQTDVELRFDAEHHVDIFELDTDDPNFEVMCFGE